MKSNEPMRKMFNFPVYLGFVYLGMVIIVFGWAGMELALNRIKGAIVVLLGSLMVAAGFVFSMVALYRVWQFTITNSEEVDLRPSVKTAGKAVGFLFVPFYNIYWIFIGIGRLPRDLNALAKKKGYGARMPVSLGISICIVSLFGVIPYVNYVTSPLLLLLLYPVFIYKLVRFCENIQIAGETGQEILLDKRSLELRRRNTKSYFDLFNADEYGINYAAGIALFIGFFMAKFIAIHEYTLLSHRLPTSFIYVGELIGVPFDMCVAALFVVLSHRLRNVWHLAVAWGGVNVVMVVLRFTPIYMIQLKLPVSEAVMKAFNPVYLFFNFLFGAYLMLFIIMIIKKWGVRWWNITGAFVGASVTSFIITIAYRLIAGNFGKSYFSPLITGLLKSVIVGYCLYWGFCFYLDSMHKR